jgi:putative oxidoreductase
MQNVERIGRVIFAWSIVAIGIESIVFAKTSVDFTKGEPVLAIIPYPPASLALAVFLGIVLMACGVLLLRARTANVGAMVFAAVFTLAALAFDLPRVIAHPASIPLRTLFFQTLTMAALAWMLPAAKLSNNWVMALARLVIGVSLIVYGVDHFLALVPIGADVPSWIPFHVFWVAFFGIAFIAAGISFVTNIVRGWAALGLASMFALFELTLHVPTLFGAYNNPGAIHDPDAWCSVFIVSAFCGGFLALARARDTAPTMKLDPNP